MTDIYMELEGNTTDIRRLYKSRPSPIVVTLRGRGVNMSLTMEIEQLTAIADAANGYLVREAEKNARESGD